MLRVYPFLCRFSQNGDNWNDSIQSKEKVEANLLSKYEATMRRERALAYAYSHQVSNVFLLAIHRSLAFEVQSNGKIQLI